MILNNGAFLFDNQDFLKTLREIMCQSRLKRPRHTDFENAYPDGGADGLSDAHIFKGLQHIQVRLA